MNIAIYLRKSRSDPEDESMEETLSRHKKTLMCLNQTKKSKSHRKIKIKTEKEAS